MLKDPFGDIILIGTILDTLFVGSIELPEHPFTSSTSWIAKLNDLGEVAWANTFPQPSKGSRLQIHGADLDVEGNIYLTGQRGYKAIVQKLSPEGDSLFLYDTDRPQNSFGGARWTDIAVNNLGDIYVCGLLTISALFGDVTLTASDPGFHDFIYASYDKNGTLNWVQKSDGLKSERLFAILPSYSSFIIAGQVNGENQTFFPNIAYSNLYMAGIQYRKTDNAPKCNLFNVFPNPNSGTFWLAFNEPLEEDNSISIFDVKGRFLRNISFTFDGKYVRIDLNDFASGVYFIQFNNQPDCAIKKIVVH